MVGIVIVSYSIKLAEGVLDATKIMADGCPVAAAGGLPDGTYGTGYERIKDAILSVHGDDGVIVLMDMGSAVMTAEMVLEELGRKDVVMADCPIAEGAVAASLSSLLGDDLKMASDRCETVTMPGIMYS